MKHYFNPINEQIFAYEEDGSQDHLIDSSFVPIEGKALSDLQAKKELELSVKMSEKNNSISPQEKLLQFLNANPDVSNFISKT